MIWFANIKMLLWRFVDKTEQRVMRDLISQQLHIEHHASGQIR
jgi:hypothetical protein